MLPSELKFTHLTFASTLAPDAKHWIPVNMHAQAKYSLHLQFAVEPNHTYEKNHGDLFMFLFILGRYMVVVPLCDTYQA
jgi:hypothetical protein